MTAILSVVTRLSGIFIVIMGVRGLIPYVVALKESPAFAMHDQLGLMSLGAIVLIGLVMTMFPVLVAGKTLAPPASPAVLEAVDADGIARTLIGVMGLYFLADALVNGAYYIGFWTQYEAQSATAPGGFPAPPDLVAGSLSALVELLAGLGLLLASGRIGRLMKRLREF